MSAWCMSRGVGFRVSKGELPADLPLATRYWVEGFLVGNLPRQPDVEEDSPAMAAWQAKAEHFLATGSWPPLMATEVHQRWWEDSQVLSEIGRELAATPMPAVEVSVPKHLAETAVAAWQRGDGSSPFDETGEQRTHRRRAADLALIGCVIEKRGRSRAATVAVDLSADLIAAAIGAAED